MGFLNLTYIYIYLLCECAVLYTVSFLSVFMLYRVLKSVIRCWVNKAKNIVVELRLMDIKKHFAITLNDKVKESENILEIERSFVYRLRMISFPF